MQTRTVSIPLLLILHFILRLATTLSLHGCGLAVTSIMVSKFAYFCFGGTNAISSLDLSLSYNGISVYEPTLVGILLLISNFGTSIIVSFAFATGSDRPQVPTVNSAIGSADHNRRRQRGNELPVKGLHREAAAESSSHCAEQSSSGSNLDIVSTWISIETLAVMAACAWLREHLFVWTVFSPRFLYGIAWVLGWHVLGNAGLGMTVTALHVFT